MCEAAGVSSLLKFSCVLPPLGGIVIERNHPAFFLNRISASFFPCHCLKSLPHASTPNSDLDGLSAKPASLGDDYGCIVRRFRIMCSGGAVLRPWLFRCRASRHRSEGHRRTRDRAEGFFISVSSFVADVLVLALGWISCQRKNPPCFRMAGVISSPALLRQHFCQ